MDDRSQGLLQEQIVRTARALLQYVGQASPWTALEDSGTVEQLRQLIHQEQQELGALARLLRRRHIPFPYLGPFPEHFMTLNFLSLDRLLPLLVEHQREEVAELAESLPQVQDAEALAALQQLLQLKRRHLEALEELSKKHPAVGVRV